MTKLIHARISERILTKVDRLFTNKLSHVFVELLQNARRAAATTVEVTTIEQDGKTTIIFQDNGHGIEDFGKLLHLGDSGWDDSIERAEDPAGMGFFSLSLCGVDVVSGSNRATISPEQFLGASDVEVKVYEPALTGTRLTFVRDEQMNQVKNHLTSVAKYGSIDVILNGEKIERSDFLDGALKVKSINGVRIGIFKGWEHRLKANFHGSVIEFSDNAPTIQDVIRCDGRHNRGKQSLHAAFDILETSCLRLQLPDRSAIVQDDRYHQLMREARIALFEYLAEQPGHCASFALYKEARELGVQLKEAEPYLQPYFIGDAENGERFDERPYGREILDLTRCALVEISPDRDRPEPFTFELGYTYIETLDTLPVLDAPEYRGYHWYDSLPVYRDFELKIDNLAAEATSPTEMLTLVRSIRLSFVLATGRNDKSNVIERFEWALPFAGYCTEYEMQPEFFITDDSAWLKKGAEEPFDLYSAAKHVAFCASDDFDSDSHDTQRERFEEEVHKSILRVLHGKLAEAELLLQKAVSDWDLQQALNQASVQEVRIYPDESGHWKFELIAA